MWILESGATRFAGSMPKAPCFAHETMSSVSRRASFSKISTVVLSPSAEAGRRPAEAGGGKSRAMRPAEASGSLPEVRGSQICFLREVDAGDRAVLRTAEPATYMSHGVHKPPTFSMSNCSRFMGPWRSPCLPRNGPHGARNEPPDAPGQPRLSHERAPREFPYGRRHSTPPYNERLEKPPYWHKTAQRSHEPTSQWPLHSLYSMRCVAVHVRFVVSCNGLR